MHQMQDTRGWEGRHYAKLLWTQSPCRALNPRSCGNLPRAIALLNILRHISMCFPSPTTLHLFLPRHLPGSSTQTVKSYGRRQLCQCSSRGPPWVSKCDARPHSVCVCHCTSGVYIDAFLPAVLCSRPAADTCCMPGSLSSPSRCHALVQLLLTVRQKNASL